MNLPLRLQNVEVLADRDLRSVELRGQASDQHTAIVFHHLYNQTAAFFVKHEVSKTC
jgi:hypothetical protein